MSLDLRGNRIGEIGAQYLADALKENKVSLSSDFNWYRYINSLI